MRTIFPGLDGYAPGPAKKNEIPGMAKNIIASRVAAYSLCAGGTFSAVFARCRASSDIVCVDIAVIPNSCFTSLHVSVHVIAM